MFCRRESFNEFIRQLFCVEYFPTSEIGWFKGLEMGMHNNLIGCTPPEDGSIVLNKNKDETFFCGEYITIKSRQVIGAL